MIETKGVGAKKGFVILLMQDEYGGISKGGAMPCDFAASTAYMEKFICAARPGTRNAVIMGKNTYIGLPPRRRPLPDVFSIVLNGSGQIQPSSDIGIAHTLDIALTIAFARNDIDKTIVVGGQMAFSKAVEHPCCIEAFVLRVMLSCECDRFLPESFSMNYWLSSTTPLMHDGGVPYRLERYRRRVPWPPENMADELVRSGKA